MTEWIAISDTACSRFLNRHLMGLHAEENSGKDSDRNKRCLTGVRNNRAGEGLEGMPVHELKGISAPAGMQ